MASAKRNGDQPKLATENGQAIDAPGTGHNSAARATALDKALENWCKLQEEEDALLEKYIQPVRDKKAEVKSDLKSEFGIPTKAFNARAQLRMIERQDDDEVVLALNEMFAATPVGNNLDLIALTQRVEQKRAEKAAAKSKATAEERAI